MSNMKYMAHMLLGLIILTIFIVPAVSAAGTGQLTIASALDIEQGQTENVSIYLSNTYNPNLGNGQFYVYFDQTIVNLVAVHPDLTKGVFSTIHPNYVDIGFFSAAGYDNGDVFFADLEFEALKNDGSVTSLGIVGLYFNDIDGVAVADPVIANGTFTTKDDVAPVITITTPYSVGKNFQITGTITEVGGMGTATATLSKGTSTIPYNLVLTDLGNGAYTYTVDASWAVFEDGISLTVNAVDAAGNAAAPVQKTINVVDVGFSDPSPEGFINVAPYNVSVFMNQMDTSTVAMMLKDGTNTNNLIVTIDGDYAKGAIPPLGFGDGQYSVNVTGKDSIAGNDRFLEWSFTLDRTTPTLAVTITDSDGDGYIEANEALTFTWTATAPGVSGFDKVSIVDKKTSEVLWSSTNPASTEVRNFPTGNRDLSFRAYDNAGNYAAHDFHLYNNYVAWVNSTKMGTISGLNTEFTAMVDMDRTASSMITLYNGRSISAPDIGTVTREVKNVGQVTSDTYVTVDNRADATYAGADTYQAVWAYEPSNIVDFSIIAPAITRANIVMMEANESYLNALIDSGSTGSVNYTQLVKNSAYIFIEGGWTKITVNPDGSYTQDIQRGTALTASGTITQMMKNPANQVDLSSGFRMSTDCVAFDATTTPPVGDYALAALAFDGDRIGVIAMMPVVILETADQGTISATTVVVDGTFDASVSSNCKYFGVALYRDIVYDATATVDFSKLNYDMVTAELSAGGAATEKFWHNVYITPGAGKYAAAKNANTLTFDVSGLQAGNYKAVLAGLSNNGTAQLLGVHDLIIGAAPTPTPYYPYYGGSGGGGSSVTPVQSFTSTGLLQTGADGITTSGIIVSAADGLSSLSIGRLVKALDANGKPLNSVTINSIGTVPPTGSSKFTFAGHAVEMGPSGATFSPAIQLTFKLTEEEWDNLAAGESFFIKWYNEALGEWEDIPTSVNPTTHTVTGQISHFSTFALFKQIVESTGPDVTQTPTQTGVPGETTTPTTPGDGGTGGFPWVWVVVVIVLIAIVGGGYYYMQQKK